MKQAVQALQHFWKNEEGQGLVEYGLIIGLIAVVLIGALTLMGGSIGNLFGRVNSNLDKAGTTSGS